MRKALAEAEGRPICQHAFCARVGLPANSFAANMMESEGASGPLALALRYLLQGLPGVRSDLPEWSYQSMFYHDQPTVLHRYWWPRFVAPIKDMRGVPHLNRVIWINQPGEREAATLKAACEAFRLRLPAD